MMVKMMMRKIMFVIMSCQSNILRTLPSMSKNIVGVALHLSWCDSDWSLQEYLLDINTDIAVNNLPSVTECLPVLNRACHF